MRRIAVLVATTDGPVRIERITRERAPQSMVCLKRTSSVLPISAAYDSFVRPGSGVIERTFGPFEDGAFRLDLSAPIDTGLSWQLGAFIAHAIAAKSDVVLSPEGAADTIVLVTGAVDCDLAVGSVGHIAEKVHAAGNALSAWVADGKDVTMLVRAGADHEAAAAAGLPQTVRLTPVVSALDALAAIDLALPGRGLPSVARLPAIRKPLAQRIDWRIAAGLGVAAAVVLLIGEWPAPKTTAPMAEVAAPTPPMPSAPSPVVQSERTRIALVERRAPPGHTCAQVQFGRVTALETPIHADSGAASTSKLQDLCGLGLVVDNGSQERFVALDLDVLSGKLLYGTERPDAFDGRKSFRARETWLIDLPRRMDQPFEIRALAVSADRPTSEAAARLDANPHAAAGDLQREGFGIAQVHHRVLP